MKYLDYSVMSGTMASCSIQPLAVNVLKQPTWNHLCVKQLCSNTQVTEYSREQLNR
jgi:hypothetical protein